MLDQSFSLKSFKKLIVTKDFSKYDLGVNKTEVFETLEKLANNINSDDYTFTTLTQKIEDNVIYSTATLEDEFALRKVNDNLKRLYKFKQANRYLIIEQIISLLKEEVPMHIIKLDIEKFYESIDRNKILKKLVGDPLLSYNSKKVIAKFNSLPEINSIDGLPRGINISASMSEIFMRDFDKKISQLNGVYYYARYVDDIIIFTFERPSEIIAKAGEILEVETGLKLNSNKTKLISRECRCENNCTCGHATCRCLKRCRCPYDASKSLHFEYLGYKFIFSDIVKYSAELVVTLADKKVRRIKTRIALSVMDFIKNRNFNLLNNRIRFLSSNFVIKRNVYGEKLNAGIYYNYPHVNEKGLNDLDSITLFLRKLVNSKNKAFGTKMSAAITGFSKQQIVKYNFRAGFKNRRTKLFSTNDITMIKKCWRHV